LDTTSETTTSSLSKSTLPPASKEVTLMLTSTQLPAPPHKDYGQIPQYNPIEFALYRLKDDKWEPETGWFKCRDFFNDVVSGYHGFKERIYGFAPKELSYHDYGVWIRLKNLYPEFFHNVELLKPVLDEIGVTLNFVPLADVPSQAFVLFPRKLFENTFVISKVTLMIRMCNCKTEYNSWEEVKASSQEILYLHEKTNFNKRGLTLPEKYANYWYYAHRDFHSQIKDHNVNITHDCGFRTWENNMEDV